MAKSKAELPSHIEETITTIAKLHADHDRQAALPERLVERLTKWIGRPSSIGILTVAISAWLGVNIFARPFGRTQWDAPPFDYLQGLLTLLALYVTILILITQRRDDKLTAHRDQLTLQLAILGEQKSAKIIALLEEMRVDHPHLPNRIDDDANAMAVSADPQTMLSMLGKKTPEQTSVPKDDIPENYSQTGIERI
ncbi:DUF1003 domain-containing protein [Acidisoma silvae]|uniref:DUF1003 domain-containing protein n=1 Tax=Acidisoma silvae TaxID=2802396 RepID=A0A963YVL8_9PROT|nr:DUF1003 domain-containing protein [Acidisoma silvae]MCB8877969.1 DUF1003 domain-containing protein [Acidisoma silvae]